MSVLSTVQQFTGNAKAIASVVPYLNKLVKKKSEDELFEIMIDDEKFKPFINDLYDKLPPHVKLQISKETLIPIIESTKVKLLKKKKFKKKLEEYSKKK